MACSCTQSLRSGVLNSVCEMDFIFSIPVQKGPGTPPPSILYSKNQCSFAGGKRPKPVVDHVSLSGTCRGSERVQLYLNSPFVPSRHVTGRNFTILIHFISILLFKDVRLSTHTCYLARNIRRNYERRTYYAPDLTLRS